MKFFSYICNCVALDTGMCGFHYPACHLAKVYLVCTFGLESVEL